ncbi:tetratricopeptide repeat protein [Nocardia sp. NPDC050697]|uniref:tetratricopeptide repeat protein n=1 Tax=Nocardia sp. NPDC050697 TaxID=3155158 RepID=UPI00340F2FF3
MPDEQSSLLPEDDGAAGGVRAEGERSVAVGGDAGLILTGDHATARVVHLPPEAFESIAEVEAPSGIDNLPPRPGSFVGRDTEIDNLTTVFTGPGPVVVTAVHGLGGVGKSTLVAHWAANSAHGYAPIVWITADTVTEITAGLVGFATRLQPALAQAMEAEQLAERALQWLATHTGWLLVLDNVDDITTIASVLARVGTGGRVVITSRRASGWQLGTSIVRLNVLNPDESLRLLTALLTATGPRDADGAAELCAELGHLPLAIEQAGAYLAQDPFLTPRDYLQLLADYPADMFGQADVDTGSERTIARTWRVTLDRITDIEPAAVELLRTVSWYAPDAIPLILCQDPALDLRTHSTARGLLAAYNMITPHPATGTISVHRLVQAVARTPDPTDPHRGWNAIERACIRAAETLHSCLPDREDPVTWSTWRALLPHIETLTSRIPASDEPATTNLIVRIRSFSGLFMLDQGLHVSAMAHLHQAFSDCERVLGHDHPNTLTSCHNLAGAYETAGRIADAIQLYEQTLADRERVLGADHPDTLTTRNNLVHVAQAAGRIIDVIHLCEQGLVDSERIFGAEHLDTLIARSNLAYAYQAVGRIAEAIPLYEQTLTDSERILGHDHRNTLLFRSNVAAAYQAVGRIAEAIPLHEQTLTDSERILGHDHPSSLAYRSFLASAYQAAGGIDEAIPLHEQTLTDRERILGHDHPDTLAARGNLAHAYETAGRIDEAIPLHEQTLTDSERILGHDHPNTLICCNNLASAYYAAGRIDEAIPLLEQTLSDFGRILGHDHPNTLNSYNNLASAYQKAGRIDEAIPLLEQTLIDRERILGAEHPSTTASRNNLAFAYQRADRIAEAIPLYEQSLIGVEGLLGAEHPNTLTICDNLAFAYLAAGRLDEAIPLYERVLVRRAQTFGSDHYLTRALRDFLAVLEVWRQE